MSSSGTKLLARRTLACSSAVILALSGRMAQAQTDTTDKTFFTRRDAARAGVTLLASAALSHFDARIARWAQSPNVQGSPSRYDAVKSFTWINETPLTIAAVATWGVGRLTGSSTMADVGLHATEALALTVAISEAIRIPLGRARPRASPNDQYEFRFGRGLTQFEYRAFPSLHASAGFAVASAVVGELRARNSSAVTYVAPVLYGIASIPGFTRLYLNQHWASDVLAGAALGQLIGSRVVRYAHTHKRSRLDGALLSLHLAPGEEGTTLVGFSLSPF